MHLTPQKAAWEVKNASKGTIICKRGKYYHNTHVPTHWVLDFKVQETCAGTKTKVLNFKLHETCTGTKKQKF